MDEHEPNELTAIPVAEQALRKAVSASSEGDEVEPGFDHFMDKAQERLAALRSSGKLSRRSAPKRDEQADSLIAMLAGRRQG